MIRKATQSDVDYIQANPFEESIKDYSRIEPKGDMVALVKDGKLWGCGGVLTLRLGVGEFWLMLVANFKDIVSAMEAVTEIERQINLHIQKLEIIRAQAHVRTDFKAAIKMVEFMGFRRERLSRKCLPGDVDAYIYSRMEVQ